MTPYDHPELRRLLAGILADPGDDGPRLAWADALAELGDGDRAAQERAEFIRLQVEVAGLEARMTAGDWVPSPGTTRRVIALQRRAGVLLAVNGMRWLGSAPTRQEAHPLAWTAGDGALARLTLVFAPVFRRGFVGRVTCKAKDWTDHADVILTAQPVTTVTLTTWPGNPHHREILEGPGRDWEPAWVLPTLMLVPLREREAAVALYLRNRWPNVEFVLPSAAVPSP